MFTCLIDAAQKLIEKSHYDYVIFGHSHIPSLQNCASGVYANAGDWINNSSYLEFSQDKLVLKKYKYEGE